jgi:cephalosporin hydroxylase
MADRSTSGSARRLRRALAARWDAKAIERARLLVDRGRREGIDPQTKALSDSLTHHVLPVGAGPQDWNLPQRALRETLVLNWLAEVAAGSATVSPEAVEALSAAFAGLYHPTGERPSRPAEAVKQTIVDQFHLLYYHLRPRVWEHTFYRGIPILKLTSDLWVYLTLIDRVRPGLIIETGTRYGGSALWMADQLELLGSGRVVSVDIDDEPGKPQHPRVTYLTGSSTDDAMVDVVRQLLPTDGSPVMVILDSDHSKDHVLAEMRRYAPLVTSGSYLIVEDTNINGHPVFADFGPGPYEAVEAYFGENDDFEVDEECELYYVTQNPRGYLRRR